MVLPRQAFFTPAMPRLRVLSTTLAGNLADTGLLRLYLIGFALMGAFVTVYNYLTFRLSAAPFGLSTSVIGALFTVYAWWALHTKRAAVPEMRPPELASVSGTLAEEVQELRGADA